MGIRFTAPIAILASYALWAAPKLALACGCVAPPTAAEPVVQAGERIVFAHEDGKVTAHIQLQYEGLASEFAWLLPLPSLPEFKLSSEQLFDELEEQTAPRFVVPRLPGSDCSSDIQLGCSKNLARERREEMEFPPTVAVEESNEGPYDYAILRADDKEPMLEWLRENGYFVPAATESQMDPYIRPGAYFLALKLRSGQAVGEIQPVMVQYESDLPMVPIILTSVAATPDMGILVWVLGDARAIPLNYQHVQINEEHLDWTRRGVNYAQVVARAIDEADEHHAFVTEFAGPTDTFRDRFGDEERYGSKESLYSIEDPVRWVRELRSRGVYQPGLLPIFRRAFPVPDDYPRKAGVPVLFYAYLETSLKDYPPESFDVVALTDEVWARVVEPALEAKKMFENNSVVTRMFTVLSPEEMTEDPVFSYNPDLPMIAEQRFFAAITDHCKGDNRLEVQLRDGRVYLYEDEAALSALVSGGFETPSAIRVERLRLEGAPEVVVDNTALLEGSDDLSEGGCVGTRRARPGRFGPIILFGLILGIRMVRRRR